MNSLASGTMFPQPLLFSETNRPKGSGWLPPNLAPWNIAYFKLQEFENLQVQDELSGLLLKQPEDPYTPLK
jgi:hypothetical protein